MRRFQLIIICCFVITSVVKSQAYPIYIDGTYSDWEEVVNCYGDNTNDGGDFDFVGFCVSNDNDFLFVKVTFSEEVDLTDNNEIYLDIDTDNDPTTGWEVNGIGAELDWNFGQKFGYLNEGSDWEYIYFDDIQLRLLPTVTSTTFEIAIGRHVKPNGSDFLFTGDTIKLCFTDDVNGGDNMPNEGEFFTYVFDNTDIPGPEPTLIEKEDSTLLRLMSYNIRNDFDNNIGGLDDPDRIPSLTRIFKAISPDIITLNECWNTTTTTAKVFLDDNLPLETEEGWYTNKLDGANITASRYPIFQNWLVHPDRRITACLINLPESFETDIMVISAHFACCNAEETRQLEADAFASFILEAKTQGGYVSLEENTPIVLMGDLNLVGLSQQLSTLLNGDIQDTYIFGEGGPLDWDESNMEDLISRQTDKRMAYTWRNDWGSYPPGRLDFMIYTNSVMDIDKAFTLQTEVMPEDRLELYNLDELDTRTSSDHFPKVADFDLEGSTSTNFLSHIPNEIKIFPNPASTDINIISDDIIKQVFAYDNLGSLIINQNFSAKDIEINISHLVPGFYILKINTKDGTFNSKLIIE